MKQPVIQFADFGFQYKAQKNPTLTGINLTIYEGEKVLILGSSGSGKTTLASCINGLVPFSYPGEMTGSCKVNGRETRELSVFELSRDVGTVLQDSNAQFVGLSVGEDMAFAMENNCVDRKTMHERVREHAKTVGMEQFINALPFHLSGGQKQKAALGGVLGEETRIFIFDEPLASLDPKTGAAAIDLIDQIVRVTQNDGGPPRTAIIIEHRLEDALFRPVDRIILVDRGQIAADMPPAAILKTAILAEKGIRLPLYIGALKYAGCELEGIPALEDVNALELSPENRARLGNFFSRLDGDGKTRSGDELIRVEAASFSYETAEGARHPAIENATLTVRRGERIAFIGKNGAGKSTMAKLITGICRPEKGTVFLDGEDCRKRTVKEIGEKIGYVMQDPDQMIVKDIIKDEVELALRLRKADRSDKQSDKRIEEQGRRALEACELYRMRNWPVNAVSYGQKKRVTVASVLALEPDILILDEPTAGQDYRHYREIIAFINRLNDEYGKTVIFITHDMHLAIENTDRAVVFAGGQIIADGDIFSILTDDRIVEAANLKRTSLHILAEKAGLPAKVFIRRYIRHEKALGTAIGTAIGTTGGTR
ncbi:MAG: ABC transporter ATP-binding protein [Spirochaetaceae bacterium]|nr:ABC transporter ATP-binding protein [Spirochaetaceae bacterium]